MKVSEQRKLIEPEHPEISVTRQCELIGLSRSSYYYESQRDTSHDDRICEELFEIYVKWPFYGVRRLTAELKRRGFAVGKKRVSRLMKKMNIKAIYPGPKTSVPNPAHEKYPYLLDGVEVKKPNQVWSTDITFIKMPVGYIYVTAIIDWYSRYVLAWRVSTTMDTQFCLDALNDALKKGNPEIFNTDQGSQFTSIAFTSRLKEAGIKISMDGKGRALDNAKCERLWRTLKYEEIHLHDYETVKEAISAIGEFFAFYNCQRVHQSLGYELPIERHFGKNLAI